jgi:hypothetical protein
MDFLVLSPPVTPPSEPPSGAFLLTAALRARGIDAALLDLSLEFFHQIFEKPRPAVEGALRYLVNRTDGYTPNAHRSAAGHLHSSVSKFGNDYPGWKLTMMDIAPPGRVHHPTALAKLFLESKSPFQSLYESRLAPILDEYRPKRVLISLAYLSQLPAAVDLHRFLVDRGTHPIVGGSLPNSLHATGHGFSALQSVFPQIVVGDGSRLLLENNFDTPMLSTLSWPRLLSKKTYLSSRPIIPLVLSSGCFWNQCLFCPDREMPYFAVRRDTVSAFVESIPNDVREKKPVIHLLDSAVPPNELRAFLRTSSENKLQFFGFARPTVQLLKDDLIEQAATAGCLMLQLGAEGGSDALLHRFHKGIHPNESKKVILRAAAAGIRTYLYLLFGLPSETKDDLEKTMQWAADIGPSIDFLNLSLFNLPRYCELSERADEFGIDILDFPEDTEEEGIRLYHPFQCNNVDPRIEARKFLKEFRSHPSIRNAHLQTPRWFRAAHLALMNLPGRIPPELSL